LLLGYAQVPAADVDALVAKLAGLVQRAQCAATSSRRAAGKAA
jgi:hypothetical protein